MIFSSLKVANTMTKLINNLKLSRVEIKGIVRLGEKPTNISTFSVKILTIVPSNVMVLNLNGLNSAL